MVLDGVGSGEKWAGDGDPISGGVCREFSSTLKEYLIKKVVREIIDQRRQRPQSARANPKGGEETKFREIASSPLALGLTMPIPRSSFSLPQHSSGSENSPENSYPATTPQLSWWVVDWPLSCSPSEVLLRTGLYPLIEHRTPDGPIALVERIHRRLSQLALVLVVPVRGRRAQTALSLPFRETHGGLIGPGDMDTEIHLPGYRAIGGQICTYIL
jgi:hypothetical protein